MTASPSIMVLLLRAVWMVALLLAHAVTVSCIPSREFDSMLDTLRARGYDLFCNAIVTSDLQIDLTNNHTRSFTFFAPTDASLFALDMTQTASSYTDTLRFHIVPRRLSLAHLRLLPDGYSLPTLLPQRSLLLTRRPASSIMDVGGVRIAFPGIFYGRDVAVHGLAGILSLRSINPPSPAPVLPPIRSAHSPHFSPRSSPGSPENQTVLEPEPDWMVHPPVNLGDSPVATPVVSPPRYPESVVSLPPEGYSDAAVPAPAGLEQDRTWWMKTKGEAFRNCEDREQYITPRDHHVRRMQCYAA
ncbi:FAS1 domain [Sesbania bispinosa]|nr:FAS1 domain [Sesbania bispinosa]